MRYVIQSIIESYVEGASMDNNEMTVESDSSGELLEQKPESDHMYHHISEAKSDHQRFFHTVKLNHGGISQVTNVNVNVQPSQDDPVTGCFKGFFKCMK